MNERILVGVAGGSGSGKTTVVEGITRNLESGTVSVLQQDAYYRDLAHLSPEERGEVNFDHPDALETDLLTDHLSRLRRGEAIKAPVYDFSTHTRSPESRPVPATKVVILEGILVLADPRIRTLLDMKVFVDTDPDIRFIRRLQRDVLDRGRSMESVVCQYLSTVRPMHLEFVEGSRTFADIIIPEGGRNSAAFGLLVARLRGFCEGATPPARP